MGRAIHCEETQHFSICARFQSLLSQDENSLKDLDCAATNSVRRVHRGSKLVAGLVSIGSGIGYCGRTATIHGSLSLVFELQSEGELPPSREYNYRFDRHPINGLLKLRTVLTFGRNTNSMEDQ